MLNGTVTWVKALQDYFSNGPFGKKVEISEFKQLTMQDKVDFHQMLTEEGYDLEPLKLEG